MTKEEKIALIEEIMDLDEGTLTEDSILADFEEWDSLSKLSLIAEAKQNFGIILGTKEISSFEIVGDIVAFLK